jgi:hypothetical protein
MLAANSPKIGFHHIMHDRKTKSANKNIKKFDPQKGVIA